MFSSEGKGGGGGGGRGVPTHSPLPHHPILLNFVACHVHQDIEDDQSDQHIEAYIYMYTANSAHSGVTYTHEHTHTHVHRWNSSIHVVYSWLIT